MLRLTVPYSIN